jgi:hypothetical protein
VARGERVRGLVRPTSKLLPGLGQHFSQEGHVAFGVEAERVLNQPVIPMYVGKGRDVHRFTSGESQRAEAIEKTSGADRAALAQRERPADRQMAEQRVPVGVGCERGVERPGFLSRDRWLVHSLLHASAERHARMQTSASGPSSLAEDQPRPANVPAGVHEPATQAGWCVGDLAPS